MKRIFSHSIRQRIEKSIVFIFSVLKKWLQHFCQSLIADKGYLVVGSILGIYLTLFYMVEAKHDRDSSNNSASVSNFFMMVSSGHNLSTIPALRNFSQLQNVEVVEEPRLLNPFDWYRKIKPNVTMLRDWAEVAFTNCKPQVCSSSESFRIELTDTDISGAYIHYSNLSFINLKDSDLRGANFRQSNMSNSDFSRVRGVKARFAGVNLSGSTFENADLKEADFGEVLFNFKGVKVTNLENANFTNANLTGANLDGAILIGADFSQANLQSASFRRSKYSETTKFPSAFNPKEFDMELVEP